jgi:hypothetical protein
MNEFIKVINKYVILLIVISLFGMPWFYIRHILFENNIADTIINYIPAFVEYLIRLIVIVLLIIDFRKYNLKNVVISCIGALFFPLLGIVIFALMLLENERT